MGAGLYDGTAGIALFLAELARRTGNVPVRRTAVGAVRHALARRAELPAEERDGLFGGLTGIAFVSAYIGALHEIPNLVDRSLELVDGLRAPLGVDVMDGRAGMLLGLLALADVTGEPRCLERANEIALPLAGEAMHGADLETVGFAHGCAGLVAALAAAARATGSRSLD